MAKQLLIDATRGKETGEPPWLPYAGVHCGHLIGEPADRFLQDPELLARGIVHTARLYRADGIPLLFDLSVEAHALGCDLAWWEDNVPSVTTHPCDQKTPREQLCSLNHDLELAEDTAGYFQHVITQTLMALDPLSRFLRNFESAGAVCPPPPLMPRVPDPRTQASHDAMGPGCVSLRPEPVSLKKILKEKWCDCSRSQGWRV